MNIGYINYKLVQESDLSTPLMVQLAKQLEANPYMTPGEYLARLTRGELHDLVMHAGAIDQYPIATMAVMLAQAEGLEPAQDSKTVWMLGRGLASFAACESLCRKGLVKFHRENATFGTDKDKSVILEPIDQPAVKLGDIPVDEKEDPVVRFKKLGMVASYHFADDTGKEYQLGAKAQREAMAIFDANPSLEKEMREVAKGFLWTLPAKK